METEMPGMSNNPEKAKEQLADLKQKAVDEARQDQVRGGKARRPGDDDDDDLDELEVQR
jgi:hypothetical protein